MNGTAGVGGQASHDVDGRTKGAAVRAGPGTHEESEGQGAPHGCGWYRVQAPPKGAAVTAQHPSTGRAVVPPGVGEAGAVGVVHAGRELGQALKDALG